MKKNNIKTCKYCNQQIAKNAKRCPKCGGKLGIPGWCEALITVVIVFIFIVGCVNSCFNIEDEVFGRYDNQSGQTSFKVGEIFQSEYLKIIFESSNLNFNNYSQYSTLKDGYKVAQFKFMAENIGENNQSLDYTDFACYANGKAMKQFYGVEDAGLLGGGTISKGKRIEVSIYCEVPKDSTEVSVEFKPLLAKKNYEFIANNLE